MRTSSIGETVANISYAAILPIRLWNLYCCEFLALQCSLSGLRELPVVKLYWEAIVVSSLEAARGPCSVLRGALRSQHAPPARLLEYSYVSGDPTAYVVVAAVVAGTIRVPGCSA